MKNRTQTRVEYRSYRLPFLRPVLTAHGPWRERCGVLARVEDAARGEGGAGQVYYAESAPLPWSGRAGGRGVFDLGEESSPFRDAARLTGRCAPAVPPDAAPREVAALLPAGRAAVAALRERRAAGFRTFKWKVGVAGDPAEELDILDELCAELPSGDAMEREGREGRAGRLRLDANGGWDQQTAERWLARCAELGAKVEFVEQPIWAGPSATEREQQRSTDVLLGLGADYPTALALDESLIGDGDVRGWIERGWQGVFVLKPTLLAEPAAVLAELARADARVVFSSALETATGAKDALRWAFAWETLAGQARKQEREGRTDGEPSSRYALGFGVWPLFAEAALNGPLAAPFLSGETVEAINLEAAWSALS